MIQAPNISSKAVHSNLAAIAACMDELAIHMVESADTLRTSPVSAITGNSIAKTVSSMEDRAQQIRTITAEFRESGDIAIFDQACKLAGWHPNRQALEMLQVTH